MVTLLCAAASPVVSVNASSALTTVEPVSRSHSAVAALPDEAEICGCNGVCKGKITGAIAAHGLTTVDGVRALLPTFRSQIPKSVSIDVRMNRAALDDIRIFARLRRLYRRRLRTRGQGHGKTHHQDESTNHQESPFARGMGEDIQQGVKIECG